MHVLKPSIGLDEPVVNSDPLVRDSAALAIVCRKHLLLVKSANGRKFGFPQGGVEATDATLKVAALREAREEVTLTDGCIDKSKPILVLGECLNPIPQDRNYGYGYKRLMYLAISVWSMSWVKLNSENTDFVWVRSYGHLLSQIGTASPEPSVKMLALHDAIDQMHDKGLLSWTYPALPF